MNDGQVTKKFGGRIFVPVVDLGDVQIDDVIFYADHVGMRTRFVKEVGAKTVIVDEPTGFKPPTRRINKRDIKELWRWRGRNERS